MSKETPLSKMQTNLSDEEIQRINQLASDSNMSRARVMRLLIVQSLNSGLGISRDIPKLSEEQTAPIACPSCGKEKDELDNPALLISGRNWSCYICGQSGVW